MMSERKRKQKWCLNPRGKDWSENSNKFGQKLLEKMGWTSGKGLGANEDGMTEHIRVAYKNDTQGMGFKETDDQWTKHESDFSKLLSTLGGSKNGEEVENANDSKIESLEKKSQNSKARLHYRKFTRGKDVSRYSEKDLANIFGKKSLKDISNPTGKNVEKEDEKENFESKSFGVETHNGGNMFDYFKAKMPNFKNNSAINSQNDTESDIERPGFGSNGTQDKPKYQSENINTKYKTDNFRRSCFGLGYDRYNGNESKPKSEFMSFVKATDTTEKKEPLKFGIKKSFRSEKESQYKENDIENTDDGRPTNGLGFNMSNISKMQSSFMSFIKGSDQIDNSISNGENEKKKHKKRNGDNNINENGKKMKKTESELTSISNEELTSEVKSKKKGNNIKATFVSFIKENGTAENVDDTNKSKKNKKQKSRENIILDEPSNNNETENECLDKENSENMNDKKKSKKNKRKSEENSEEPRNNGEAEKKSKKGKDKKEENAEPPKNNNKNVEECLDNENSANNNKKSKKNKGKREENPEEPQSNDKTEKESVDIENSKSVNEKKKSKKNKHKREENLKESIDNHKIEEKCVENENLEEVTTKKKKSKKDKSNMEQNPDEITENSKIDESITPKKGKKRKSESELDVAFTPMKKKFKNFEDLHTLKDEEKIVETPVKKTKKDKGHKNVESCVNGLANPAFDPLYNEVTVQKHHLDAIVEEPESLVDSPVDKKTETETNVESTPNQSKSRKKKKNSKTIEGIDNPCIEESSILEESPQAMEDPAVCENQKKKKSKKEKKHPAAGIENSAFDDNFKGDESVQENGERYEIKGKKRKREENEVIAEDGEKKKKKKKVDKNEVAVEDNSLLQETSQTEQNANETPSKSKKKKKKQLLSVENPCFNSDDSLVSSEVTPNKYEVKRSKKNKNQGIVNPGLDLTSPPPTGDDKNGVIDDLPVMDDNLMMNIVCTPIIKKDTDKRPQRRKSVRFSDVNQSIFINKLDSPADLKKNGHVGFDNAAYDQFGNRIEENIDTLNKQLDDYQAEVENDLNEAKVQIRMKEACDPNDENGALPNGDVQLKFKNAKFGKMPPWMNKSKNVANPKSSYEHLVKGDIVLGFKKTSMSNIKGYTYHCN